MMHRNGGAVGGLDILPYGYRQTPPNVQGGGGGTIVNGGGGMPGCEPPLCPTPPPEWAGCPEDWWSWVLLQRLALAGVLPQILIILDSDVVAPNGVPAGQQVELIAKADSVPVRITRLAFGPQFTPFFSIDLTSLARMNLIMGTGWLPATRFNPDNTYSPFAAPEISPNAEIKVKVRNDDSVARRIRGSFDCIDLTKWRLP